MPQSKKKRRRNNRKTFRQRTGGGPKRVPNKAQATAAAEAEIDLKNAAEAAGSAVELLVNKLNLWASVTGENPKQRFKDIMLNISWTPSIRETNFLITYLLDRTNRDDSSLTEWSQILTKILEKKNMLGNIKRTIISTELQQQNQKLSSLQLALERQQHANATMGSKWESLLDYDNKPQYPDRKSVV